MPKTKRSHLGALLLGLSAVAAATTVVAIGRSSALLSSGSDAAELATRFEQSLNGDEFRAHERGVHVQLALIQWNGPNAPTAFELRKKLGRIHAIKVGESGLSEALASVGLDSAEMSIAKIVDEPVAIGKDVVFAFEPKQSVDALAEPSRVDAQVWAGPGGTTARKIGVSTVTAPTDSPFLKASSVELRFFSEDSVLGSHCRIERTWGHDAHSSHTTTEHLDTPLRPTPIMAITESGRGSENRAFAVVCSYYVSRSHG